MDITKKRLFNKSILTDKDRTCIFPSLYQAILSKSDNESWNENIRKKMIKNLDWKNINKYTDTIC